MKVIGYRGKKIKAVMAYVLSVIIGLIMESCGVIANRAHLLVVERQWEEVEWDDSNKTVRGPVFCVDVPLEGPKVLKDSVIAFLNDELYHCCEYVLETYDSGLDNWRLPFNMVRTDNATHIVEHYVETYKPFFEVEIDNYYVFSLLLLAQTDMFVTYGLEFYHCGISCGSELMCYTFDKKDGHRVRNIISNHDLFLFLTDKSEYMDKMKNSRPRVDKEEYLAFGDMDFALLDNGIRMTFNGIVNHYKTVAIDYDDIMPYLSEEVQKLVKGSKTLFANNWKVWYFGCRVGVALTEDNQTIYLVERSPHTPGWLIPEYADGLHDAEIMAFTQENNKYEPACVFEVEGSLVSSVRFVIPDAAWRNPHESGGYFDYDQVCNILYVPYLSGYYEASMHVYRFDGRHFVYTGKDVDKYSKRRKKVKP